MLKVQYRFNDKINEFPSKTLYRSELIPSENVRERKLGDLLEGQEGEDEEDLNEQVVFFDSESFRPPESVRQGTTLI